MSFAAVDCSKVAGFEAPISGRPRNASQSRLSHAPKLVRAAGLAPAASGFQARLSAADLRPETLDTPAGIAPAWNRFAGDRLLLLSHGVKLG